MWIKGYIPTSVACVPEEPNYEAVQCCIFEPGQIASSGPVDDKRLQVAFQARVVKQLSIVFPIALYHPI